MIAGLFGGLVFYILFTAFIYGFFKPIDESSKKLSPSQWAFMVILIVVAFVAALTALKGLSSFGALVVTVVATFANRIYDEEIKGFFARINDHLDGLIESAGGKAPSK